MKSPIYEKLDGWPAAIIGLTAASALAWYAQVNYRNLEAEKARILSELAVAQDRNYELLRVLGEKEGVIESFQGQIGDIASTVGTLEKLSQTDEELLKKYSKIYFLNENYVPASLADIREDFLSPGATNFMIYAKVGPYLERLLGNARANGVDLLVASAYRSFGTQAALKNSYMVTYGSGANRFSADQGYSEHQLGTAADFTTKKLGANFSAFASEPAYRWLLDNAHDYGFVLSYPENNAYYRFEPWHWRFVGIALATHLHDEGKRFYDLDQREIDQYLVKIFD